jgi:hypothetical protein
VTELHKETLFWVVYFAVSALFTAFGMGYFRKGVRRVS